MKRTDWKSHAAPHTMCTSILRVNEPPTHAAAKVARARGGTGASISEGVRHIKLHIGPTLFRYQTNEKFAETMTGFFAAKNLFCVIASRNARTPL